ncbi:AAA family ATPase [Spirosoma harenae]
MSVQPHPATSSIDGTKESRKGILNSDSQQVDIATLSAHMDAIAEIAQQLPPPKPVELGKLGDSEFYSFYRSILADSEVKLSDPTEEPTVCIEVIENDQAMTFGTLGNFSLVIGKAKSRKTYLISTIVASLIKRDLVINKVRGNLPEDKQAILYFDTEQHRGHVKRVLRRIALLANCEELGCIHVYQLKKFAPNHRLNAIRVAIEDTASLGLIIIDGIRDTVFDINDAKEATDRATDLLQWTEEKDAHLITVIHENKGNNNARGHLGSELTNKAETVVSVSRDPTDKNVSIVTPEYCRDKEFEPFGFSVGEDGLPFLIDAIETNAPIGRNRKAKAGDLKKEELDNIIRRAFANETQLRYSQLRTNLMEAAQFIGTGIGKSKAEELIQRLQTDGYLTKDKPAKEKYELYQFNPEKLSIQSS